MAISKFTITAASLFFAFSLPACSNESETSSKQENAKVSEQAQTAAWLDDSLIVQFSAGPNKGKHEYVKSSRSDSELKLAFAENNGPIGVMFFEARELVNKEGGLNISSLRRYTKGDYKLGKNATSTWQGGDISNGDECDEVNLTVQESPQVQRKFYGASTSCNAIEILSMTDWRDVGSIKKERQVRGQFSDSVNFQQGQNKIATDMTVEFVITQTELRY